MTTFYSVKITGLPSAGVVFDGYFKVYNNLVTAFYDLSLPTSNGYTDVKLPDNDQESYSGSNSKFPIDGAGLNFYSNALKIWSGGVSKNFNLYISPHIWSSANGGTINTPHTITIVKIANPPVIRNNISLYSIGVSEKGKEVELFYRNVSIDDITKFYDAEKIGINILASDDNNEKINGITYNKTQRLITDFKITNIPSIDALNGYTEWNIKWIVQTDGSLKILSFFIK